jgi:hypothetical protein
LLGQQGSRVSGQTNRKYSAGKYKHMHFIFKRDFIASMMLKKKKLQSAYPLKNQLTAHITSVNLI